RRISSADRSRAPRWRPAQTLLSPIPPRVTARGALRRADTGGMIVFALLAGIAIGAVIGFLVAQNRFATATATVTERARSAQDRAALLERAAAEKNALAEGQ